MVCALNADGAEYTGNHGNGSTGEPGGYSPGPMDCHKPDSRGGGVHQRRTPPRRHSIGRRGCMTTRGPNSALARSQFDPHLTGGCPGQALTPGLWVGIFRSGPSCGQDRFPPHTRLGSKASIMQQAELGGHGLPVAWAPV